MVQVIRKKTPYRIETWVCNALSFVSLFGSGLAPFPQKNILGDYLEGGWISILKEQPCTKLIR